MHIDKMLEIQVETTMLTDCIYSILHRPNKFATRGRISFQLWNFQLSAIFVRVVLTNFGPSSNFDQRQALSRLLIYSQCYATSANEHLAWHWFKDRIVVGMLWPSNLLNLSSSLKLQDSLTLSLTTYCL